MLVRTFNRLSISLTSRAQLPLITFLVQALLASIDTARARRVTVSGHKHEEERWWVSLTINSWSDARRVWFLAFDHYQTAGSFWMDLCIAGKVT